MDIVFLVISCVQAKKHKGKGLWIAALVIDLVVGLANIGTSFAESSVDGIIMLLVTAAIYCAMYIPTGIHNKKKYAEWEAAQQAAQYAVNVPPYGGQPYGQPNQPYGQPNQPGQYPVNVPGYDNQPQAPYGRPADPYAQPNQPGGWNNNSWDNNNNNGWD